MSDRRRKKSSGEAETAKTTRKPSQGSRAQSGKPAEPDQAAKPPAAAEGASPAKKPAARGKAKSRPDSPRIVFRDGVAYLDEYDIPIWRLEMGRRAGSSPEATIAAFPGLTAEGLDLAFAYAQEHKAEFDPLIRMHSGEDVPEEDEGDEEDEAAFEAELEALLETDAELFRRLAR
jgi:uncharacterized protein (DUF433 family)